MRSVLEFALFAWVGISVVAVLVQLVRIARYKRATASAPSTPAQAAQPESGQIDLDQRLAGTADVSTAGVAPSEAMAGAAKGEATTTASQSPKAPRISIPEPPTAAPAPSTPPAEPADAAPAPAAPVPEAPAAEVPVPEEASVDEAPEAPAEEPTDPTLADLLAGVRLPWNLLPTVDQSREPSNDRVVLITSEGEPGDIGVDVADELERLGFTIAPRGDDTAIATRGDDSLGLQIIENPMAAEIDGVRRFPTATESSVALDIWVE